MKPVPSDSHNPPDARVRELEAENARLRAFAFGDAPEWEKANTSLKHRVRELEAEVARLREALQWIADHEHDEDAIAERSVCPNDFHTTRMPAEDAWCPDCFSRWWATDGSLPPAEGNYAMGAVAREALEAGER